ncbi:MAG: methyltransferase domain-containing protein [Alistipes onderdonkii]
MGPAIVLRSERTYSWRSSSATTPTAEAACVYSPPAAGQCSGRSPAFADKEFDYVICNQVLEHSDDPAQFLREVTRVGKARFIETPSLLGEWLFPKNRTGGLCSTSATNWFSTTNSAYPATMPTITENCS